MFTIRIDPADPWVERRLLVVLLRLVADPWDRHLLYRADRLTCAAVRRRRYLRGA